MGKKKNKRKRAEADEAAGSGGDDDEGVGELIGFVHDGELFLRDATTGIIFDAERDPAGRRVRVGTWDSACQQPRFDPKPVAPVAAPAKAPAPPPSIPHPPPDELTFIADEEDHCETAPQAYEDIAQLLHLVAASLGKASSELRIYDPYFCNGAVARHLNALGFPHVYNRNEDFYAVQDAGSAPAHDVVVTSPPYSGTHPQRLLSFLTRNAKPWLVLMPNWVYAKEYYEPSLSDGTGAATAGTSAGTSAPLYLVPYKRYYYWTPRGRRMDVASGGAKSKTHGHTNAALGVRTSPFVSFWYVGGVSAALRKELHATPAAKVSERCRVCWGTDDLPPSVWADGDSRRWGGHGGSGGGSSGGQAGGRRD